MIAFILIWLLTLDACQTHTPASSPPQPMVNEEEVVPKPYHTVTQPEDPAPKNMSEHKHLELLEGQLDWMKKRIRNEKAEWNDR